MRVATPGGHRMPWVSNFCETNVRTYVRDEAGRAGIWFLSLDAARLGAVVAARVTPYRLPYFWSSMRLRTRGPEVGYLCRRRWPGPRSAASRVRITVGEPFGAGRADRTRPFPHGAVDAVQRRRRPAFVRASVSPAVAAVPGPG